MAKPNPVPTQQAVNSANQLVTLYLSDLEEQARRVAREERGSHVNELVATDYEEADRRVRRRLGRRRTSPWGPLGSISAGLSMICFTQVASNLYAPSAWWRASWWHGGPVLMLGGLLLLAAVLCEFADRKG